MVTKNKTKDKLTENMSPTPDMVQDYIAAMLRELSEMASTSGLPHVSSLLQVSLLAVNSNSKFSD